MTIFLVDTFFRHICLCLDPWKSISPSILIDNMKIISAISYCVLAAGASQALTNQDATSSRRSVLQQAGALVAGGALLGLEPTAAFASGGATAGKYTWVMDLVLVDVGDDCVRPGDVVLSWHEIMQRYRNGTWGFFCDNTVVWRYWGKFHLRTSRGHLHFFQYRHRLIIS